MSIEERASGPESEGQNDPVILQFPTVSFEYAFQLEAQKQFSAALDVYQTLINSGSQNADIYYNQGNCLFDLGRYDAAILRYTDALGRNPNLCGAWNNMGNCYFRMGKVQEAEAAYKRALELNPLHSNATINLQSVQRNSVRRILST